MGQTETVLGAKLVSSSSSTNANGAARKNSASYRELQGAKPVIVPQRRASPASGGQLHTVRQLCKSDLSFLEHLHKTQDGALRPRDAGVPLRFPSWLRSGKRGGTGEQLLP